MEDFFAFVNGAEHAGIDETGLEKTPFGYQLPETETGDPDPAAGVSNEIVASIILGEGFESELEAVIEGSAFLVESDPLVA